MISKKEEILVKLLALLCILTPSQGKWQRHSFPYLRQASSFSTLPPPQYYDYIIVGGGTAGCPLAATLSQKYNVLLLERGGSPYGNRNVSYMQNFHISLADMSPSSASQPFVSTDGVINTRARVLGGGTSINAGFYTRASPGYVTEVGWDGKLVNESYPWVERRIVHWPKITPWQDALRKGLLQAGVSPFNGYTFDHLYGTKVGGTIFDDTGYRSTAADLLQAANPKKLRVLLHASGAIGSPQLLILSGIGPKEDLERLGIKPILHNQHVGKQMSDNPMNSIFVPTKKPVKQSLIETVGITKAGSYIEASSGFGQSSDSIHCHHGIMSAEIGQLSTIPPKQRSLELARSFAQTKRDIPVEAFRGGFILEKVEGPLSKGQLTILNTDIETTPNVTFNYFSHPQDLRRCVFGVRTIEQILHTKSFADLSNIHNYSNEEVLRMSVQANVNFIPKHMNDTKNVEQFCRDTVITIWHYHGGCHVGKVVDRDYHVFGVDGLRVIDGSTLLKSPGTNPQATFFFR